MAFPVALQLYSVRNELNADFYGTLKKVKELGYDGVEFAGMCGHKPEEIKAMCDELGLIPISAHVAYKKMMEDEYNIIKYIEVGCKYIAVPHLSPEERPGGVDFPKTLENIKKFGKVAKEHGAQLVYHNHDFEFIKLDGKYGLDVIYDSVPADLLETELDTCWVNVGGEDPVAYLKKYAGRSSILHLKDFVGEKSEHMYELIGEKKSEAKAPSTFEFRPVGYGKQNFPAILEAAKACSVKWIVVEQDEPSEGMSPIECAAKSIAYLKTINK